MMYFFIFIIFGSLEIELNGIDIMLICLQQYENNKVLAIWCAS